MKHLFLPVLPLLALFAVSCSGEKKADPTAGADWRPEDASVARHITAVHHFVISPEPTAHLQVTRDPVNGKIVGKFRDDVFKTLGGEKALYILGWDGNPHSSSRHEYLFFLEALHAYLVLNHPEWDGGEGESQKAAPAATDADQLTDAGDKAAPVEE
jgi:hypothetical protein